MGSGSEESAAEEANRRARPEGTVVAGIGKIIAGTLEVVPFNRGFHRRRFTIQVPIERFTARRPAPGWQRCFADDCR